VDVAAHRGWTRANFPGAGAIDVEKPPAAPS